MRYRVTLYSLAGAWMVEFVLSQAEFSKLVQQVRDGDGFITTEKDGVPVYDLIPARVVGRINVIEEQG